MLVRSLRMVGSVPEKRCLCTSCQMLLDQNWRKKFGLSANPNTDSTLRDQPDYSFADGRPTPYGSRQRLRINQQREVAGKVMSLSQEVDEAIARNVKQYLEKRKQEEEALAKKLKKKGDEPLSE